MLKLPNLEYGIWTYLNDICYFKKIDSKIVEVYNIPKKGSTLNLPKRKDLKGVLELRKIFGIIHNHIYANEGFSPTESFTEIIKLLFIKIYDEKFPESEYVRFGISEQEFSQIMNGKNKSFRERIETLFNETKKEYQNIFSENEKLTLKDATLAFIVGQLQNYNLSNTNADIKGMAFQKFIFASQRGDRGQFLTPDPIIKLAVQILKPKSTEKILDPACGTGGFLIEALKYVRKNKFSNIQDDEKRTQTEYDYASHYIRGVEINPTIARVAKMNMILQNDGSSGINCFDSLTWDNSSLKSKEEKDIKFKKEKYDIILTNPPFGSQGRITNKNLLKNFELAHKWVNKNNSFAKTNTIQSSQVPDILFIERCLQLLKFGGKLAIVLPTGNLENKTLSYVRQYILDNAKLLAVISLPTATFIPHGTGIKADIIFLEKKTQDELEKLKEEDYDIFFSIIENIGYEGNKNGTPIYIKNDKGELKKDKKGNYVINEDITKVTDIYDTYLENTPFEEKDLGFIRKYSEIEDRLDPEYYRPYFKMIKTKLLNLGAVPLKSVVKIESKRSKKFEEKDLTVRYIEIGDINSDFSEITSFSEMKVHELPSRARYELKEGDIITAVSGISTGTEKHASAFITKDFDGYICTNGLRVFKPRNINPFYLLTYLKSEYFLSQMLKLRTGAAIPAVNDDDLKNVLILLPSKEDEKLISSKIEESFRLREEAKKCLHNSIENLQNYIDNLKEQPKSKEIPKEKDLTSWF